MRGSPTFEVHGNSANDLEREQWLRDIYDAAEQHARTSARSMHEVCYWPGSIEAIDHTADRMFVCWSDAISQICFRWAFDAAWDEFGDDTPVRHVSMGEDD